MLFRSVYHTVAISLSYSCYQFIIQLLSVYHTVAISLSYSCYQFIIQWLSVYHTVAISLSYFYLIFFNQADMVRTPGEIFSFMQSNKIGNTVWNIGSKLWNFGILVWNIGSKVWNIVLLYCVLFSLFIQWWIIQYLVFLHKSLNHLLSEWEKKISYKKIYENSNTMWFIFSTNSSFLGEKVALFWIAWAFIAEKVLNFKLTDQIFQKVRNLLFLNLM